MTPQNGKGDKYRPVDRAKYEANYDAIFKKKTPTRKPKPKRKGQK